MDQEIKPAIIQYLSSKASPAKAIDISKAIKFEKQDVNKNLYALQNEKRVVKVDGNKWQIASQDQDVERDSVVVPKTRATPARSAHAPPMAATSSDSPPTTSTNASQLVDKILKQLSDHGGPISAPELARKLGTTDNKSVKRELYGLEKKGEVKNISPPGTKPLWTLVTNGAVRSGSSHRVVHGSSPAKMGGKEVYTKKETDKGIYFEKVTQSDLATDSAPLESVPQGNAVVVEADKPNTQRPTRKIDLAANFGSLSFELNDHQRSKVNTYLQNNKSTFLKLSAISSHVSATMDITLTYLKKLTKEGKVEELENDEGVSYRWNEES